MTDDWMGDVDNDFDRELWHNETLTKLEYYESEYRRLKESTSLLELAMWKARMNDDSLDDGKTIDPSAYRLQCCISCGADHVVENVWRYLLPPDFVCSYVNEDSSDDDDEYEDNYFDFVNFEDDGDDDDDNDDEDVVDNAWKEEEDNGVDGEEEENEEST